MSYRDFAKLKDGRLAYAEKYMLHGDTGILNPSDELLRELGYKPVNYNSPADPAPDGYHWEITGWKETENEIRRVWEAVADPVPSDEDELDPMEAADIIMGGGLL